MCVCSFLGQIVFGGLMLVALVLTVIPIFTSGWQQYKSEHGGEEVNTGIFKFSCKNDKGDWCKKWWENMPPKMKAVAACMCLALITQAFAILWTIVTLCACCCKQFLIHLLPFLAFISALFLAIAVGIFGVYHKSDITGLDNIKYAPTGSPTYSFYLACGALAASMADVVVGILTVTLANKCL
ncbi:hypothetical protein L596_015109 [Steinernema carpocapsae]|uniref:Uncharacterized protein n=1 Tax=Steinernema carpocapsae TaxID=34508 RepID=A0A4U5NEJ5_STECR|nr:hypothetical protein L596_015109 [Steinernema carpocapsae]